MTKPRVRRAWALVPLTCVCVLGSLVTATPGRSDDAATTALAAGRQAAELRDTAVEQLSAWLLSMNSIEAEDKKRAADAMRLLGQLRAPEAVPALRKHWAFDDSGPLHETPSDWRALWALGQIGLPALPALADIAAEGYQGEAVPWPFTPILAQMGPPEGIAGYLEQAADKEIDPGRHKRLLKTAADVRRRGKEKK